MKSNLNSAELKAQVIQMPITTGEPINLIDIADEAERISDELYVLEYATAKLAADYYHADVASGFGSIFKVYQDRLKKMSKQIQEISRSLR